MPPHVQDSDASASTMRHLKTPIPSDPEYGERSRMLHGVLSLVLHRLVHIWAHTKLNINVNVMLYPKCIFVSCRIW